MKQWKLGMQYYGDQLKRAIKTNTPREQTIKDRLSLSRKRMEDEFTKQSLQKDPLTNQAYLNEKKRMGTLATPKEKRQFQSSLREATGYKDFAKQSLKDQGKQLAKGIKVEGFGLTGKMDEYLQKSVMKREGKIGSQLNRKWKNILKRQKKGTPSLNPSDLKTYAQRIGKIAKQAYGDIKQPGFKKPTFKAYYDEGSKKPYMIDRNERR